MAEQRTAGVWLWGVDAYSTGRIVIYVRNGPTSTTDIAHINGTGPVQQANAAAICNAVNQPEQR